MPCGNKKHFMTKGISHACGVCKNWTIAIYYPEKYPRKIPEICKVCKKGECQFVHNLN